MIRWMRINRESGHAEEVNQEEKKPISPIWIGIMSHSILMATLVGNVSGPSKPCLAQLEAPINIELGGNTPAYKDCFTAGGLDEYNVG